MKEHAPTIEGNAEAMWDRFIKLLNERHPLSFRRDEPPLQHKSFLGSIASYRTIFLEANAVIDKVRDG